MVKRKKKSTKALSFLLAIAMVLTSITVPMTVKKKSAKAAVSGPTTQENVGLYTGDLINRSAGRSYVYFGNRSIRFRVLDKNTTEFGGNTMLLDSDHPEFDRIPYDESNPGTAMWTGSLVRSYLNGASVLGSNDYFYDYERSAIVPSVKSAVANDGSDPLIGDKIFVLSYSEAQSYYSSDSDRSKSAQCWLRTQDNSGYEYYLDSSGGLYDAPKTETMYISPALNIDLSKILFTTCMSGPYYRLTLLDDGLSVQTRGKVTRSGDRVTIPYTADSSYSVGSGSEFRVAALVLDKPWAAKNKNNAKILQYTTLASTSSNHLAGTDGFTLNFTGKDGKINSDFYIYLVPTIEKGNGYTNVAGTPEQIEYTEPSLSFKANAEQNGYGDTFVKEGVYKYPSTVTVTGQKNTDSKMYITGYSTKVESEGTSDMVYSAEEVGGTTFKLNQAFTNTTFSDDVVLYAQWSNKAYSLTFKPNVDMGGYGDDYEETVAITSKSDATSVYPSTITVKGHKNVNKNREILGYTAVAGDLSTLVYKKTDTENKFTKVENDNITTFDKDTVLYAYWEDTTVDIVLDANGGEGNTVVLEDSAVYNENYPEELEIKDHYKDKKYVLGYATNPTSGSIVYKLKKDSYTEYKLTNYGESLKVTAEDLEEGKITLYAVYEDEDLRALTLDKNGGYGQDETVEVIKGFKYPETVQVSNMTYSGKEIYGFSKEANDTNTSPLNSNLVYIASNDAHDTFTRTEQFAETEVQEDETLYAIWTDAEYKIAYYKDANDSQPATITNEVFGKFLALTKKQAGLDDKKGYTFLGWSTDPDATEPQYSAGKQYNGGVTTKPGETVSLYAVWKLSTGYKVDYDGNGSNETPAYNIPASTIVLYNEGDTSVTYKIEYAVNKNLEKVAPQRDGYVFLGWATEANSDKRYKLDDEVELKGDTVFYAQWKRDPVVRYDANGGVFDPVINESYYQKNDDVKVGYALGAYDYDAEAGSRATFVATPSAITRKGYKFKGWTVSKDVMTQVPSGDAVVVETTEYYLKEDGSWGEDEEEAKVLETGKTFEISDDADDEDNVGVIFKVTAQWQKEEKDLTVEYEADSKEGDLDVYTFKATQDYSITNNGKIKDFKDVEIKNPSGTAVDVIKANSETITRNYSSIKDDATLDFNITVSNAYDPDDMVVKVKETGSSDSTAKVYKPYKIMQGDTVIANNEDATATIEQPADGDAEEYTFFYRVSNVENALTINVSGAEQYTYDVHYVNPTKVKGVEGIEDTKYNAGVGIELTGCTSPASVTAVDYTFAGWYETEEEALRVTAANQGADETKQVKEIDAKKRGSVTYYAAWQGKEYTVTYYTANYLSKTHNYTLDTKAEQEARFGSNFDLKKNTEITGPNGAAFLGWSTDPLAKTPEYKPGQTVKDIAESGKDSIKLYAVWDISKVKVTFDANGGSFVNSDKSKTYTEDYRATNGDAYKNNDVVSQEPEMQRNGYSILGWSTDKYATIPEIPASTTNTEAFDTPIYEDLTYYAIWSAKSYTLKYFSENNADPDTGAAVAYETRVEYGKTTGIGIKNNGHPVIDPASYPDGMNLAGWTAQRGTNQIQYVQGESIVISTDVYYLYPVFVSTSSYTLTYSNNGGTWTGFAPVSTVTAPVGDVVFNITNVVPIREGYTFLGWSKDADATEAEFKYGDTYVVTEADAAINHKFALYAVWQKNSYSIEFKAGNSLSVSGEDYVNAASASAIKPKVKEELAEGLTLSEDEKSYVQKFKYDTEGKLAPYQYDYPGFRFVGWSENASGSVISFTDNQDVMNLTANDNVTVKTLYAVWTIDTPVTVTYKGNGNTPTDAAVTVPKSEDYVNIVALSDEKLKVTLAEPTDGFFREGCKFIGWSKDAKEVIAPETEITDEYLAENKIIKANGKDKIKASTTYYAVWQAYKTYKVTYELNGGKGKVPTDDNVYCEDGKSFDKDTVEVKFTPAPKRDGYTFDGWADNATSPAIKYKKPEEDGDEEKVTFKITNNTTLSAIWATNEYTIKYYDSNKNSLITSQAAVEVKNASGAALTTKAKYDEDVKLDNGDTTTPALGYKFIGWAVEKDGTVVYKPGESVRNLAKGTENDKVVKLYAVYGPKTYRIVLDDDVESYTTWLDDYKKNHFKQTTVVGDSEDIAYERTYKNDIEGKDYKVTNTYPTYELEYGESLKDITVPSVYGFDFTGYKVDGLDTVAYDSSANAKTQLDLSVIGEDKAKQDENGVAEIVLKATWNAHDFNVTFIQDDKKIDQAPVTYGEKFTMPKTVKGLSVSSDYKVVGWTTNVDNQYPKTAEDFEKAIEFEVNKTYPADTIAKLYNNDKADILLYPVYKTTVEYNVYFSAEDATNVTETQKVALGDNFKLTFDGVILKTPKKTGYTFTGWSDKKDFEDNDPTTVTYPYEKDKEYTILNVEDDVTLYAEFEANVYTVSYYDVYEETAEANEPVSDAVVYPYTTESGDTYTFKTTDAAGFKAPKGYKLAGWSLDKNAGVDSIDFYAGQKLDRALATETDDEIKLYAVWAAKSYNVAFNKNAVSDASGEMNVQLMTYDKAEALSKNMFTADDYEFLGWATEASKSAIDFKDSESVNLSKLAKELDASEDDNVTVNLYAVWKPVITAEDKTEAYTGEEFKFDVSKLFTIPEKAGKATYTLTDNTADAELDENELTVTKSGTYTIEVVTADGDGIASATAKATVTIDKATASGKLAISKTDETKKSFKITDTDDIEPKVTFTAGDYTDDDVTIEYKVLGTSDETYTDEKPVNAGKYRVRATVGDTGLYEGFTLTADFTINDKEDVDAKLKLNADDDTAASATVKFDYNKRGDLAPVVEYVSPTLEDEGFDVEAKGGVVYEYKLAGTSDETYTDEKPEEPGTYLVRAIIPETKGYLGLTLTRKFVINEKKDASGYVKLSANTFAITDTANIDPKLIIETPVDDEEYAPEVVYEYKKAGASDETFKATKPTEPGDYVVRAVVSETASYKGYTTDKVSFTIGDKIQAAGNVLLDEDDCTVFAFADTDKIEPKVVFMVPQNLLGYMPVITYSYKLVSESDDTYDQVKPVNPGKYIVRAEVADTDGYKGFTATKKFEISNKKFASVITPAAVEVGNGAAKTVKALNLPETVEVKLEDDTTVQADVTWDLSKVTDEDYNRSYKVKDQTFTVEGTVTIPDDVIYEGTDEVTTSVKVTVKSDPQAEAEFDRENAILETIMNVLGADERLAEIYNNRDKYDSDDADKMFDLIKDAAALIVDTEPDDDKKAEIIDNLVSKLNEFKTTDEKAAEELEALKDSIVNNLDEKYEIIDKDNYRDDEQLQLAEIVADGKQAIKDAETAEEAYQAYVDALKAIEKVKTNVDYRIEELNEDVEAAQSVADAASKAAAAVKKDLDEAKEEVAEKINNEIADIDEKISELSDKVDADKEAADKAIAAVASKAALDLDEAKADYDAKIADAASKAAADLEAAKADYDAKIADATSKAADDLEAAKADYDAKIADAASKSAATIADVESKLNDDIAALKTKEAEDIAALQADTKDKLDALKEELEEADETNKAAIVQQILDTERELQDNIDAVKADTEAAIEELSNTAAANIEAAKTEALNAVNDAKDELNQTINDTKDVLNQKIDDAKDELNQTIGDTKDELNQAIEDAKKEAKDDYDAKIAAVASKAALDLEEAKADYDAKIADATNKAAADLEAAKADYDTKIADATSKAAADLEAAKADYDAKIADATSKAAAAIADVESKLNDDISALKTKEAEDIATLKADAKEKLDALKAELEEADETNKAAIVQQILDTEKELQDNIDAVKADTEAAIEELSNTAAEDIEAAKEEALNALKEAKDELDQTINDTKDELNQAIEDAKKEAKDDLEDAKAGIASQAAVDKKETQDEIEDAKSDIASKAAVDSLETAKKNAVNRLEDFIDGKDTDNYLPEQVNELEKIKADFKDAVKDAESEDDITNLLNEAKKKVKAVKTSGEVNDEKAVKEVTDLIDAIGDATKPASEGAVTAARKAYNSLTDSQKKLISETTLNKLTTAEKAVENAKKDAAAALEAMKAANTLTLNSKLKVSQTGKKIKVSWGAVKDAEQYRVYVQYCSKSFPKTATKTIKKATTKSVTITKLNGKKLNLKKNFKLYVAAYKTVDGKLTLVGKTITAHVVGRKNTKYTNAKSITLKSAKKVSLAVGKTSTIKAKTNLVDKKKKQLTNAHAKEFRYASSDKAIATVSAKGKITAKKAGTCIIYVYSRNGYAKQVKVTVK